MKKILVLENTVQEYEWGSKTAIPRLLNRAEYSEKPQAELWLGGHPKSPSKVFVNNKLISIIDLINSNPKEILGEHVSSIFNNQLPFLLKILAVEKPLSVQAHPDKKQAKRGFLQENKKGIPLYAKKRIYKDKNHKPEIICAITPFYTFNGFRSIKAIIKTLKYINSPVISDEIDVLINDQTTRGFKTFFKNILSIDKNRKINLIHDIVSFSIKNAKNEEHYKWISNLSHDYPNDIGIFCILMLNFIKLKPGQAMYLPACQLHCYLKGVGVELMSNSDNVLRCGLTPKHIDIHELLNILRFEESKITIIDPGFNDNHEKFYRIPQDEFILSCIHLKNKTHSYINKPKNIEILICTYGAGYIKDESVNEGIQIKKGMSFLIFSSLKKYSIHGNVILYKASIPLP